MDSFEVNKILGAILGTCLGVLSINIAAGAIFAPGKPAKPGYEIVVPEQAPAGKPAEQEKRSEEHTSELQSPCNLVCRLLLEKKKKYNIIEILTSLTVPLYVDVNDFTVAPFALLAVFGHFRRILLVRLLL